MRVTNSLVSASLQSNIEASLNNLNQVQQEIATGKKLNHPSDDPAGAALAMSMRTSLNENTQYQRNANNAKSFLSASDSALSDVTTVINQARQIASQGANSTQTTASLTSMATQIDGLMTQLSNVSNQNLHGKYLFSGSATTTPPYSAADPTHTYAGDSGSVVAMLGPNDTIPLNTTGPQVFDPIFSTLQTLKANLLSGNITAISSSITSLDANLDTTTSFQATIGAKINEVTTVTQNLTRAQGDYQKGISDAEDVDLAQAYVELQSAQNIYQASLVTTSKAYAHSLADYL